MGNKDKAAEKVKLRAVGALSTWAVGVRPCLNGARLGDSDPSSEHRPCIRSFWPLTSTSQLLLSPQNLGICKLQLHSLVKMEDLFAFVLPLSLVVFHPWILKGRN